MSPFLSYSEKKLNLPWWMLPCMTLRSVEWNNASLHRPSSLRKQMAGPFGIVFLGNDFFPRDLLQQPYKRFVAGSAPSVVLYPPCESRNSPRVKWQEIIMANHVLWWYCLYRKDCTWLSVPLGNTKLSYKSETNYIFLVATMTSVGQPTLLHATALSQLF